jgi:hypothetical protein
VRVTAEERRRVLFQRGERELVTRAPVVAGTERQPRTGPRVADRRRQRRQHQGSFGDAPLAYRDRFAGGQRRRDREQRPRHDRLPHRLRPGAFRREHAGDGRGVAQQPQHHPLQDRQQRGGAVADGGGCPDNVLGRVPGV